MKVLDPVCNMRFVQDKAAATAQYEDKTYYFCSDGCHQRFLEHPEQYVNPRS